MKKIFSAIVVFLSVTNNTAFSSPIDYDFEKCEQQSITVLKHCFKNKRNNEYLVCWDESKKHHKRCYKRIGDEYSRDKYKTYRKAKIKAEKAAREKRKKELSNKNQNSD